MNKLINVIGAIAVDNELEPGWTIRKASMKLWNLSICPVLLFPYEDKGKKRYAVFPFVCE